MMTNGFPSVARDPFDESRPLQDRLACDCYGCGTLNSHGLHIKSRWDGDVFVCEWQPKPEHIAYPGIVYGGTIASVVDCHAVWAALSMHCRSVGHDLYAGAPPFRVVTASLLVNFLRPASIARMLELRASVMEQGLRKSVVTCSVWQGPDECASAEVVTVRLSDPG